MCRGRRSGTGRDGFARCRWVEATFSLRGHGAGGVGRAGARALGKCTRDRRLPSAGVFSSFIWV